MPTAYRSYFLKLLCHIQGLILQILIYRTVKCDSVRKFLRRFFQKATADPTRGALVASAEAKRFFRHFFFAKRRKSLATPAERSEAVFICASGVKEKSGHKV